MRAGSGSAGFLAQATIESLAETRLHHPLNPASDVFIKRLAPLFGLKRLTLSIARVPPGKESFAFHRHEHDEEFLLILSGHGRAEIGEDIVEVGPGDVMGFATPDGPPHHMTNPYQEDLVYLMGGESSEFDIAHFPRTDQKLIFRKYEILLVEAGETKSLTYEDWQANLMGE